MFNRKQVGFYIIRLLVRINVKKSVPRQFLDYEHIISYI